MFLLAIDTCDSRGSVALLRGEEMLQVIPHESNQEYSAWLLPAISQLLAGARLEMADIEVYVIAAGPGSFTGVRVGLTTVKAWSEVYGRRIAAISRLEAVAAHAGPEARWVAAVVDAQRHQVFAALYQQVGGRLERLEDEMVIAAEDFVALVNQRAAGHVVSWVSTDPECVQEAEGWRAREGCGDTMRNISAILAPEIGRIGSRKASQNQLIDALTLDANYVRRSDAEIFWKPARNAAVRQP